MQIPPWMDRSDCDVMILISIVTMVMIRNQPWCVTITSFGLIFPFLGRQCQSWVLGLPQQGQVWSAEVMEFSWVGSVVVKNHGLELANKSDFGNFLSPQFFCRQRNSLGPSRDGNNFAVSFIFISLVLSLSLFIWVYSITFTFHLPNDITFTFYLHLVPTFHFPPKRVQIYWTSFLLWPKILIPLLLRYDHVC